MKRYDHKKIERKWQKHWFQKSFYKAKDFDKKPKYYILDMFPYPSGEGLHVGHVEGYTATDVVSRYMRMKGYNVLHPMGWDAFGLPAENYAIKNKIHPKIAVDKNIKRFKKQLQSLGFSYDWSREINTTDPEYYKWTQWIFLKLFEKGLAYEATLPINWCPSCRTGLANEEVVDGKCERCGSETTKKNIRQWVLKITAYADRLLKDLGELDWPEKIKAMQRNWIGRSEGAVIRFKIQDSRFKIADKKLKFDSKLIPLILSGDKYITYRLEPKNFKVGDVVEFLNSKTKEKFALAEIIGVEKKKMGEISEKQEGHEKFKNKEELYKTYENYYKTKVNDNTDVWIYHFKLQTDIEVFTTRPDTLFGATYLVISPEHDVIQNLGHRIENLAAVKKYIEEAKKKSDLQRTDLAKEKTGVELKGIKAINPVNGEEIPAFVADYVLAGYGTGAIMAVPAHDQRDFDFAKKYKLPVKMVICPNYPKKICPILDAAYEEDGYLVDSKQFNGVKNGEAKEKIVAWLAEKNLAKKTVNYKLRDWVFSRQRYWGEPIPIIKCMNCGNAPVPEKDLPLKLPNVKNYEPTGTGESPLAAIEKWVNVKCPKCGAPARRETNTMPQWAGSCWYYLAYLIRKNSKFKIQNSKLMNYWLPVDLYVGGVEHAVLHLLYSRFWHKFLYDIGVVSTKEPFQKLVNQGLILGPDGQKMSKSRGNVINPDNVIKDFGADSIRLYEMFMGPFEDAKPWDTQGIIGVYRFLNRVYNLIFKIQDSRFKNKNKNLEKLLHQTIKKVTEDIENFRFNTAISAMMVLVNEMEKTKELPLSFYSKFLILLSPFAPHIVEELWRQLGNKKSAQLEKWPKYDEKLLIEDKKIIVAQINGKVRAQIEMPTDSGQKEVEVAAKLNENIKKYLENSAIKKIIFVKDKLINFVV